MAAWQDRNAMLAGTAHAHLGTLRELVTRYDKLPETASGIPLHPDEWTGQLLLAVRALLAEA
jgi:hypothetical protein